MNKNPSCIPVNRIVISQALWLFCCISVAVVLQLEKHFCRAVSPPKSVIVESGTTSALGLKSLWRFPDICLRRE